MSNGKVVQKVRAKSGHGSAHSTPVVFVGAGNLGGAVLRSLVAKKIVGKKDIHVITATEKSAAIWRKWGVSAVSGDYSALKKCREVWLAVKPSQIREVAPFLLANLRKSTKIYSLLAGWSPEKLKVLLRGSEVLSVMTNTAARLNAGLYAVFYAEKISSAREKSLRALFSELGYFCGIYEQNRMPAITALIGSMPAFWLNLERQYRRFAALHGLESQVAGEWFAALQMAHQKLLASTPDVDVLIREIATPGGCTEKGLQVLDAVPSLQAALTACSDKAREMGS